MLSKQVFIVDKECYEKWGLLITWVVIAWVRMLPKSFGSIHHLLQKPVFVVVWYTLISRFSNSLLAQKSWFERNLSKNSHLPLFLPFLYKRVSILLFCFLVMTVIITFCVFDSSFCKLWSHLWQCPFCF